jgi:uncharacterized protein (TIGR02246 family)
LTVVDIDAVVQAFREGVAGQDAEALAGLYHANARFLPPNMEPFEGRPAIQRAFQQLLDMGVRSVDLQPIDVREAGDLTIEYGRYTLGIDVGGESVRDVGKYVVVHESRPDGSTKILYDIFNSNSPPPA